MKIKEVYKTIKEEGWDNAYLKYTEGIPEKKRIILDAIVSGIEILPSIYGLERTLGETAKDRAAEYLVDLSSEGRISESYKEEAKAIFAATLTGYTSLFTLIPTLASSAFELGRATYRVFNEKVRRK